MSTTAQSRVSPPSSFKKYEGIRTRTSACHAEIEIREEHAPPRWRGVGRRIGAARRPGGGAGVVAGDGGLGWRARRDRARQENGPSHVLRLRGRKSRGPQEPLLRPRRARLAQGEQAGRQRDG